MKLQAELKEKYRRYSENLGKALLTLTFKGSEGMVDPKVREIIHLAKCYYEDAEHFYGKQMPITALVSLAYGEGLLDALKTLGFIDFQNFHWDEKIGEER